MRVKIYEAASQWLHRYGEAAVRILRGGGWADPGYDSDDWERLLAVGMVDAPFGARRIRTALYEYGTPIPEEIHSTAWTYHFARVADRIVALNECECEPVTSWRSHERDRRILRAERCLRIVYGWYDGDDCPPKEVWWSAVCRVYHDPNFRDAILGLWALHDDPAIVSLALDAHSLRPAPRNRERTYHATEHENEAGKHKNPCDAGL